MTNYRQGRDAEYRSIRVLEAAGYLAVRTAGSHGPWDIVGVSPTDVVLCQVKRGQAPRPSSWAELKEMRRPANVRAIVHYWKPRASLPVVYEL